MNFDDYTRKTGLAMPPEAAHDEVFKLGADECEALAATFQGSRDISLGTVRIGIRRQHLWARREFAQF